MGKKDPRVDLYIADAAEFARPVLKHLRKLVHRACPSVQETIRWGVPSFDHHGILCGMAAFKTYCSFGFWKGALMRDPHKLLDTVGQTSMGDLGRVTKRSELPSDAIMTAYIEEAMELNEQGVKLPPRPKKAKPPLTVPADLTTALARNKKARATFEGFSYSKRKDYVEWVTGAKRDETRKDRLKTAVKWMAEGKPRNWKYMS